MALFSKQDGLQNQVIRQEQKSNTGPSTEIDQQHFDSIEQRIAAFEKRMNYKCKELTPEQQKILDTKFHFANRMGRWIHAYPVSSQAGLTLSNECETSAWRKQASPRNPPSKWLVAAQTSKTARALAFWEATG